MTAVINKSEKSHIFHLKVACNGFGYAPWPGLWNGIARVMVH